MKTYVLERTQRFCESKEELWKFFSDPHNLPLITPPWLNFSISSEPPHTIYPGLKIRYSVSPLLRIPLPWVSEISLVEDGECFVDEQRLGPYRRWYHQHRFSEQDGVVEVYDRVEYSLYCSIFDPIVHQRIVQPKLTEIFDFRAEKLSELFKVA